MQTLWLATQIVSRLTQHKALTLLEVTSIAIIAYAAWWPKPQDSSVSIMIMCSDEAVQEVSPSPCLPIMDTWQEYVFASLGWAHQHWGQTFCSPAFGEDRTAGHMLGIMVPLTSIFGVIQVASRGITLPSSTELWIWRGSTLGCLILLVPSCLSVMVSALWYHTDLKGRVNGLISLFCLVLYVTLRLYMIFEVFISLCALPRSAYDYSVAKLRSSNLASTQTNSTSTRSLVKPQQINN